MKASTAAIAFSLVTAIAASPHSFHHRLRRASPVVVYVYELNGQPISEADVEAGLRNGTLVMGDGGALIRNPTVSQSTGVQPVKVEPVQAKTSASPASKTDDDDADEVVVVAAAAAKGSSSSSSSSSAAASQPSAKASTSLSSSILSSSDGIGRDFPDGEIDCSSFPSAYGALKLDYLKMDGWSGIQKPNVVSAAGYNDIFTVKSGECSDDGCCTEGMYCSYACPAGYQKLQWPETQGATGQSVGGLLCKGGKLYKTSESYSTLCGRGNENVKIEVKNTLGQNVAVCRTDYPGTEAQTVPLDVSSGMTAQLTCPDSDNYYVWKNGATSAQYYANPAGISVEDACQWGEPGSNLGNYAPMNFGVGWRNGRAWISVFQNSPTTDTRQKYSVEIIGDNISGKCKYDASTGLYCGDVGCNRDGCTVSAAKGTLTYVIS